MDREAVNQVARTDGHQAAHGAQPGLGRVVRALLLVPVV